MDMAPSSVRFHQNEVASSADPFEVRPGKSLVWSNVNMTVAARGKMPRKKILDNVWGEAGNETTMILGPSGAGKTSLLHVLAGRVRTTSSSSSRNRNKRIVVQSDIRLGGVQMDSTDMAWRKQIAFVAQDDSLHISATPRESIYFSAKLRLPRSTTTDEEVTNLTNHLLKELGLEACADTVVGGFLLRGISGGEKKRTSIGVELVTKPSIVLLDEPTTGLDSFNTMQLSKILKKIANSGASVLSTIHQPASDVFESFDRLIIMNQGQVMYQGTVQDVPDYFASRGYPLLPRYNPADWVVIVAQTVAKDQLKCAGFFPSDPHSLTVPPPIDDSPEAPMLHDHVGGFHEIFMLLARDVKSFYRDPWVLSVRMLIAVLMSVLTGMVFWQVGNSDPSSPDKLHSHFGGALSSVSFALFEAGFPTLAVFPQERPVFLREYCTNHYSVVSYFMSRLIMEGFLTAVQMLIVTGVAYFMIAFQLNFGYLFAIYYALAMAGTAIATFVGIIFDDPKAAMEFFPTLIVPQIMFVGFFIATKLIPSWIRWMQYCMPLVYATRLFLEREFQTCGNECQDVLTSIEVKSEDVYWYWIALVGIFVVVRAGALLLLEAKSGKYN